MSFSESSILMRINLFIFPVALTLHIIGLATPNWSYINIPESRFEGSVSYGLWSSCENENILSQMICQSYPNEILPIWFKVCRATIIVGAVVVANAAVLELLCTVVLSKASHKIVFILTTLAAFFGAACILSMAILWAYKIRHGFLTGDVDELVLNLSWSFGLSIAGGLLAGIGGLLVAIDFCRKPT